jgi:hypothetical protein
MLPLYTFGLISIDLFPLLIAICIGFFCHNSYRAMFYAGVAAIIVPVAVAALNWPLIDAIGPHTVGQRRVEILVNYAINPG